MDRGDFAPVGCGLFPALPATPHHSGGIEDGRHVSGRATRNMDRYAIQREGDAIVVNIDKWFESDKDPNAWTAATIAL